MSDAATSQADPSLPVNIAARRSLFSDKSLQIREGHERSEQYNMHGMVLTSIHFKCHDVTQCHPPPTCTFFARPSIIRPFFGTLVHLQRQSIDRCHICVSRQLAMMSCEVVLPCMLAWRTEGPLCRGQMLNIDQQFKWQVQSTALSYQPPIASPTSAPIR